MSESERPLRGRRRIAKALGVSVCTVSRLQTRGLLQAEKRGRTSPLTLTREQVAKVLEQIRLIDRNIRIEEER